MRGIQVREGQKRVTKVAVRKLAVGAGKGRQVKKYSGPGGRDSVRLEGRYSWF